MSQHQFTTTRNERVEAAVAAVRKGRGVLVVDDEDRENEGDIIFSAASITHEQMALLIRECSGIVCLCLPEDKVRQLDLPQMVANNTCKNRTAFTISIEAAEGVTTGVSAADRVKTIRTAIADDAVPGDLNHPGHVFPLCARSGGVRERAGHTEASVDLMRLGTPVRHRGHRCLPRRADGGAALAHGAGAGHGQAGPDGPAPRDHGLLPTARYARPPGTGLDRVHGTLTKETFP